jgi:hypothetical protein
MNITRKESKAKKNPKPTTIIVELTEDEARHIAHRLNVSSSESFSDYRVNKGLDGQLHRHPFADDFISKMAEAGVEI